jgi:hypothetical protein
MVSKEELRRLVDELPDELPDEAASAARQSLLRLRDQAATCDAAQSGVGAEAPAATDRGTKAPRAPQRRPKRGPGELTPEEGWHLVEERAQRYMGMSAKEFIRAWQAGEIENPDRPEVIHVLAVLPLAR